MTSTASSKICTELKTNGQPCRAYALAGSDYCFAHDPKNAAVRAAAHSAGGKARHGRKLGEAWPPPEPVTIETVKDVTKLLEREINQVLTLEKSLSRAQTIARLGLAFVKCFEVSELEARFAAMEAEFWGRGA